MNALINIQVEDFSQKVRGYNMLFNYRLMNLCVKAEPAALIPVTVEFGNSEYNLEDVAEIRRPDEYHLEVRSKNENTLKDIIAAIMDVHPEFILAMKTEKDIVDNDIPYAYYSMPDVDKDRYNLLNNLTRGFHHECAAHIDAAYAKQQARFVETFLHAPVEESDETKKELKSIYDGGKEEAANIRDAKLKEIEEAYQRYLEKNPSADNDEEVVVDGDDENYNFDVVGSMRW